MRYLKKDFLSLLRKIDIFGVSINIRFKDQEKHRTRFGGIFSIFLIVTMVFLTSNILIQIVNKEKPIVLMEDVIIQQPNKYPISEDNFSFAVGIYDQDTFEPFMDPSYYTVEARFTYKDHQQGSNGKKISKIVSKPFNMIPCKLESFKVQNTQQYFYQQNYSKLFCLDYSQNLYLEGQFDADEFSVIEILIKKCEVNCKDKNELEERLRKSFLQIYYTTSVVQPSSFDNPFQPIGQTQFYYTNLQQSQAINMQYMNTYVIDHIGVLESSTKSQRSLLFNQDRLLLQNYDQLYLISLFLEKNKEKYYFRSYLSIKEAFSQIGGIFNFLFLLGSIICQPYSRIQLQRKLLNSTFAFPKDNNLKNIKIKNNISPNSPIPRKSKIGKHNLNEQIQEDSKDEFVKKFFSNSFQEAKVRTKQFFLLLLETFYLKKSEDYEMLQLGKEKVYQYTDLSFVINKLIEIEKLKHLILENEQIKLFEFIPKPKLKSIYKEAKSQSNSYNGNQEKQLNRVNSNKFIQANEVNILSIENKDMKFKAAQAQEAFNKIYKGKQKQSKIDKKLINMLDKDLIDLLQMEQTSTCNIQLSINNYKLHSYKDYKDQFKFKNNEDISLFNGSPPSRSYLGLGQLMADNCNQSMRQSIDVKNISSNSNTCDQTKLTIFQDNQKQEIINLDEINYDNDINELKSLQDKRVASYIQETQQMQHTISNKK